MSKDAEYGHIVDGAAPNPVYSRGVLTTDVAIGDTVLAVDDTGDFDEQASLVDGAVILGMDIGDDGEPDLTSATVMSYATCEEDDDTGAGTITLAAASPVAAASGDLVHVYDPSTGSAVVDWQVDVQLDGADPGDPVAATLAHGLIEALRDVDDVSGRAVKLVEDEDGEWFIVDVLGSARPIGIGGVKADQDSIAMQAGSAHGIALSHTPILNSEHVYWNGLYQPASEWARSGRAVSLADSDGVVVDGDDLSVEYLYLDAAQAPPTPASMEFIGAVGVPGSGSDAPTSVALPDGAQVGDLFVFAIGAGAGFGGHAADCLAPSTTDASSEHIFFGGAWPEIHAVGWGYLNSLDPAVFHLWSLDGNRGGTLAVFRFTGKVVVGPFGGGDETGLHPLPCAPPLPPGSPSLAIAALSSSPGPGMTAQDGPASWGRVSAGGSSTAGTIWQSFAPTAPASFSSIGNEWFGFTLGIVDG